ncbi:MFS transporter [Desulfobulbus alkaliphilus]|uniref:MFS transporter n=1 Tax=Desulfobulbus alkaliphilus TaxID=869814 RepID=UPI001963E46D|nr:MFS transporter [Desulfobulbus alkaliphilus]MBM9538058.1 MFS transporter [Desulfobulbus alkaliphilus]
MDSGQSSADHQAALERSALFVATLTSFMGPFMLSSVNVALPDLQADLGLNAVQLSWVATSYLLAMAICLLPAGKIADMHGRKKVFIAGLLVYTLGATSAAFAASSTSLILFRVLQGLGAAMFVTTGMAILTSIFPPQKRGRAIGIYVAAVYIGLSAGPFFGGLLTEHFGWRSIFLLMLPLGLGSVIVTLLFLKGEWADVRRQRFDLLGSIFYAAALSFLIYGASILPSWSGWMLIATGLLGLLLFFRRQQRIAHPLFEVSLFSANRPFTYSSMAALLNYSATFAVTFLMSLYLQYIKGMSPQAAGAILMVQPVMMAVFSPLAGRLSDSVEPRLLATAGMSITVVGMLVFTQLQPETSLVIIAVNLLLLGFGFALFSSPNMSAIMGAVTQKQYGIASGTAATMRLLGQMVSMAIATVALALLVGRQAIEPHVYGPFLTSIKAVFTLSALLCTVGIYFSLFRGRLLPPRDASRSDISDTEAGGQAGSE